MLNYIPKELEGDLKMKKKVLALLLVLCLILQPVIRSEAKDAEVKKISASMTSSSATVSGETDALAVMVRITDGSGKIIAMQSFAVSANKTFSASITGSFSTGTYTIAVADYEGGTWATTTATVGSTYYDPDPEPATPSPTEAPTTAPTPEVTAAPTQEPVFEEIVVPEEEGDTVTAVFDAGEIGEEPAEMSVVPDPEDENGAALLDALLTDSQQAAYKDEPVEIIVSASTAELTKKEEQICEEGLEELGEMIENGASAGDDIEVPEELDTLFSGELSAPKDEDGKVGTPEIVVAEVYDFSVALKVGDSAPVEIHDLGNAKVAINFRINKALKNTNPLIRRIFFMFHILSDGSREVLPVSVNQKNMQASVAFSNCSTFVLAYTDVAEYTEAGDTLRSSKYNAKYNVIEGGDVNGKVGILEYAGPIEKKASHTIYSTVKIKNITYKVTSIAANAFRGNKTVKKVKIGKTISKIGAKAFYKATNLEKVIFKTTKLKAANIGKSAFSKAGSKDTLVFVAPAKRLKRYKKLFGAYGQVTK